MRFSLTAIAVFWSSLGYADILEERLLNSGRVFVPNAFSLNPAQNGTGRIITNFIWQKTDDDVDFVVNPGGNSSRVDQRASRRDMALGFLYPLGGAAIGLQYGEHQRKVTTKNENSNTQNNDDFYDRDYRAKFVVDFTQEIRAAFTFHYTALRGEIAGNYNIGRDNKTHYTGNVSGYGVGLYYQTKLIGMGAFTNAPMRGKAMIEGEQKVISEPGIYGIHAEFKPNEKMAFSFAVNRWSYKHDERDESSTSPGNNQTNILLRGLELRQFYRKTMSYAIAGEFLVLPGLYAKGQYLRQEGVFLFDPDKVAGDDKDAETLVRFPMITAGVSYRMKDFTAEANLFQSNASQGKIDQNSSVGLGNLGSYKAKSTGLMLSVGANLP